MMSSLQRKPSPPVTPEMAAEIKRLKATGLFHHQIAALLEINQGRVSEVMTGKTHPTVQAAGQSAFNF